MSDENGGEQKEYTSTAIGWINPRTSKDEKTKYLTVKISSGGAGIVLREGVTFAAFPRKNEHGTYFMLICDNDKLEELRMHRGVQAMESPQEWPPREQPADPHPTEEEEQEEAKNS